MAYFHQMITILDLDFGYLLDHEITFRSKFSWNCFERPANKFAFLGIHMLQIDFIDIAIFIDDVNVNTVPSPQSNSIQLHTQKVIRFDIVV